MATHPTRTAPRSRRVASSTLPVAAAPPESVAAAGGPGGDLPEDDAALFVRYARTGCERAFAEVVRRYQPMILRYFLANSATRSRAEDLTQEVFIRLVRNRTSYDPSQKFTTWSKTIAERIAINAMRGAQRSRVTFETELGLSPDEDVSWLLDPPDDAPQPDEMAARAETRAILEDALARVQERYRRPAILHFLHGLTHTETARRLGIPVGTAKSRTHYAIRELREILQGRGLAAA